MVRATGRDRVRIMITDKYSVLIMDRGSVPVNVNERDNMWVRDRDRGMM